jgi:peptide/nickel transport system substrate-binding protein
MLRRRSGIRRHMRDITQPSRQETVTMSTETDFMIARMAEEARRGRLSRRGFMSAATAAGLTTSAATGLWGSKVAAQTPKRGGTFRWGVHDGNTSDSHDPGTYLTRQMIYLAHQYRSFLTMINPDNSLGPDLATEWSEATPDATEWTFKLNPNATFHSGKKVTAKDVVASMNHHRGDDTTSAAKALLADVVDITQGRRPHRVFKLAAATPTCPG